MTDKVYTQQELKEMADQLLAADDKKKAGKAAAQKAEEAKPAADKALEEKLGKCPAAALLVGNEKLRELFIKGKRKAAGAGGAVRGGGPPGPGRRQMDRIYDSLADLASTSSPRISPTTSPRTWSPPWRRSPRSRRRSWSTPTPWWIASTSTTRCACI